MTTKLELTNLTPHSVDVYTEYNYVLKQTYPASGVVARVIENYAEISSIDDVPVVGRIKSLTYDATVAGLPRDGKPYIVSRIVLDALPTWPNLFVPDTGPGSAVRNAEGQLIGVTRFICSDPSGWDPGVLLPTIEVTTVRELIDTLQALDDWDRPIMMRGYDGGWHDHSLTIVPGEVVRDVNDDAYLGPHEKVLPDDEYHNDKYPRDHYPRHKVYFVCT